MSDERDVSVAFDALFAAACLARDPDAVAALFASDDDVVYWGSEEPEEAVGPAALRAQVDRVATSRASVRFAWREKRVRVEGDLAWVNAVGTVTVDGGEGRPRVAPYRVTGVLVRRDGRWLWHTYNGSEPNRP